MTIVVAVAMSTMAAKPWCTALQDACTQMGVETTFVEWKGERIGARYAAVWLPPAELFRVEPDTPRGVQYRRGCRWFARREYRASQSSDPAAGRCRHGLRRGGVFASVPALFLGLGVALRKDHHLRRAQHAVHDAAVRLDQPAHDK